AEPLRRGEPRRVAIDPERIGAVDVREAVGVGGERGKRAGENERRSSKERAPERSQPRSSRSRRFRRTARLQHESKSQIAHRSNVSLYHSTVTVLAPPSKSTLRTIARSLELHVHPRAEETSADSSALSSPAPSTLRGLATGASRA